jgi:hypothetical protein
MKYLKTLVLAAMAAMVLIMFLGAGSASAAKGCRTDADPCPAEWALVKGDTLTGSLTTGTEAVLKAAFAEVKCKKTHVQGEITNAGGAGKVIEAQLTSISAEECKCGERTVHVNWLGFGAATVNDAGTVTSTNSTFTAVCTGLASCIFGTTASGTDVGMVTDTTDTGGGTARADASASLTYFSGVGDSGQFVCSGFGDTSQWSATYQLTTPDALWLVSS